MSEIALICGNWGTSNLRAFGVSAYGEIVTDIRTGEGVSALSPAEQESLWFDTVANWQTKAPKAAHLICGAAGSNQGWLETGYVSIPAPPDKLASAIKWQIRNDATIGIVPGLSGYGWTNNPERMRGEEVELIGWLTQATQAEAIICLPGTHTKWVRIARGEIDLFQTAMTGEVFAALTQASILKSSVIQEHDQMAFKAGARIGLQEMGGDTLHRLFVTRAQMLNGTLSPRHTDAFLSGLLIGGDVRGALAAGIGKDRPVHLIGSEVLNDRFTAVLGLAGIRTQTYASEICVAKGLTTLAKAGGIIA